MLVGMTVRRGKGAGLQQVPYALVDEALSVRQAVVVLGLPSLAVQW